MAVEEAKAEIMSDHEPRLIQSAREAIPGEVPDVIEWAERTVEFPDSTRSTGFVASITPWLIEPMRKAVDIATKRVTYVKPVQSGGSALGEVLMLFWIVFGRGIFQYNWANDKRAE